MVYNVGLKFDILSVHLFVDRKSFSNLLRVLSFKLIVCMSKTIYMRSFILFGGGDGGRPEILDIAIIIISSLFFFQGLYHIQICYMTGENPVS